jgi:putative ABC transport system permease protein
MGTPLTGFAFNFSFAITGRPVAPGEEPSAEVRVASADYLTTMGIPVVRGRGFTDADRAGGQKVLVLTESAARKFFPGENPIGQEVRFGWGPEGVGGEIVGVVGDVRQFTLAGEPQPMFWVAYDQRPVASFDVLLHSARDLESVMRDARQVVARLDPALAVSQVRTLEDIVAASVAQPRFYMVLLALFAAVAIGLSGVGIYGVIAYLVGRRAREIGIRLALGASRLRVVSLVLNEVVVMAVAGVVLGLAGAAALSRVLESLLFGVSAIDPLTYLAAALLLGLVALAACAVPAARAARLDPSLTIRSE